ncbi:hypothetical protein KHA80_06585 [Anaerobacillus sp. HL2]|nr:hypothetical protein KHA80_06585 [Anaerobacillus sp. HL2]
MLDQIGINTAFSYFHKLGFNKVSDGDERLPAALGGLTGGVSPLESIKCLYCFYNDGLFQKQEGLKVIGRNGEIFCLSGMINRRLYGIKIRTLKCVVY